MEYLEERHRLLIRNWPFQRIQVALVFRQERYDLIFRALVVLSWEWSKFHKAYDFWAHSIPCNFETTSFGLSSQV